MGHKPNAEAYGGDCHGTLSACQEATGSPTGSIASLGSQYILGLNALNCRIG